MSNNKFTRRQQQRRHAETLRATSERLSAQLHGGQPLVKPDESTEDAFQRLLNDALNERAKYRSIGQRVEDEGGA
ncbi:hypothetical protein OEZ49_18000 [Ruegeria sp. WL0004]|uniref:Uncharacterized protein n=1 Tax=Ruegeria marisflavi TaxID=2984152 RepID=A0ABT2WUW6_9RHOB|nr:hypothetical protein [Ruegeria sp. WL0004]MCU9839671.1 hypothetical protein [Ruegeria sp. WL0004]